MRNKIRNMLILITILIILGILNTFIITYFCNISYTKELALYLGFLIYFPTNALYSKLEIKENEE